MIERVFEVLSEVLPDLGLVVAVISMLPLLETRLAIPLALKLGMDAPWAWLYCFLGSSLLVPFLLMAFLPLMRAIGKIRFLGKISDRFLAKFQQKAQKVKQKNPKTSLGVLVFANLPLPLTGVWTASALASILSLGFLRSLALIVLGNLISTLTLTLLCLFLQPLITPIIVVMTVGGVVYALTSLRRC